MADQATQTSEGAANPNAGTDATKTGAAAPAATATDAAKPASGTPEAAGAVETVPEKYEAFKVGDGLTLDPESVKGFESAAREMGLSQGKAQSLVDLASKHVLAQQKRMSDDWTKTREGWVADIKSDKDFGGQRFEETVNRAQRVLAKYGSPEFSKFLTETGFGDNADMVRMLARIDKALGEDRSVDGPAADAAQPTAAETLYPTLKKA